MGWLDDLAKGIGVLNPVGLLANAPAVLGGKALLGGGDKPAAPGVNSDASTKELNKAIADSLETRRENTSYISKNLKPSVDALGPLNQQLGERDAGSTWARGAAASGMQKGLDSAVGGMANRLSGYEGQMAGLNQGDLASLQRYTGANQGMIGNLGNLGYQDAKSGGAGLSAQQNALSQYGALTSPQMTAQERFLGEQARMTREQQELASRDAVMGDLGARGMKGSGAEIANMLGSQQMQGQQRVMADLGMQAGAVDRSMQALQGYSDTAGQMRSSEDVIGMFNAQQGQAARQWQADQQRVLENERLKAEQDTSAAATGRNDNAYAAGRDVDAARYKAAGDKYTASGDALDAYDRQSANAWDRAGGVVGANAGLAGAWTGANSDGTAAVNQLRTAKAGNNAANSAAAMLNQKKDFELGPLSFDFPW